jgi:uncharacterized protein (TIGR02217 family)
MSFVNTLFPKQYGYDSSAGPSWKVEIVETANKREKRNLVFLDGRRIYDLAYTSRTKAIMEEINAFHAAMHGPWLAFRFWDFTDYALEDELIATGDGTTTVFQVIKTYTAGSASHERAITKLASGLIVKVNDIVVASTVNTLTGTVTFGGAPADGATIKVTGEFHVPVRFVEDRLTWSADAPGLFTPESLTLIEVTGE